MVPPVVTARRWAPARARIDAVDAVPHDAGPQLAELLGRVAAGEQVEHVGQDLVGQLGVVRRRTDEAGEVVDRPVVQGDHGHDLLGQHVERVAGVAGVLDEPLLHAVDHDRGLDQVVAVLREELAPAGLAHLVAGPADALQAPAHRAGRLDLDDEVDGAHVDAELERARWRPGP